MKDLIIVMTHGKAAQTTARHEPYWKQLGHLVYLTPENDPLPGRDAIGLHYGRSEHASSAVNRKVLRAFEFALDFGAERMAFFEYDAICLGPTLPDFPEEAIGGNAFRDLRKDSGFAGTTFTHPPIIAHRKVLTALVDAMRKLTPEVEHGFWDRYVGYACEHGKVPLHNFQAHNQGFGRNPIDQSNIADAKAAVAAGATLIHGIKDQWILSEILAAIPRSSH